MEQVGASYKVFRLSTWLLVGLLCFLFWAGAYAALAGGSHGRASFGLDMPPAKYTRTPGIKPLVVYVRQSQTNRLCRTKGTAKLRRGSIVVGCAMKIVGGPHKGRHLVYVATDSRVPARTILRHEYGHVNGWRH